MYDKRNYVSKLDEYITGVRDPGASPAPLLWVSDVSHGAEPTVPVRRPLSLPWRVRRPSLHPLLSHVLSSFASSSALHPLLSYVLSSFASSSASYSVSSSASSSMSSSASYSVSSSASSSAPSSASSVSHQITNSNIPFDEYSAVRCPLSCRLTPFI